MIQKTDILVGRRKEQDTLNQIVWSKEPEFVVVYGRIMEIYLITSVAPIPFATLGNREWGQIGQNYVRSLIALGLQALLIIICVAIYLGCWS